MYSVGDNGQGSTAGAQEEEKERSGRKIWFPAAIFLQLLTV